MSGYPDDWLSLCKVRMLNCILNVLSESWKIISWLDQFLQPCPRYQTWKFCKFLSCFLSSLFAKFIIWRILIEILIFWNTGCRDLAQNTLSGEIPRLIYWNEVLQYLWAPALDIIKLLFPSSWIVVFIYLLLLLLFYSSIW